MTKVRGEAGGRRWNSTALGQRKNLTGCASAAETLAGFFSVLLAMLEAVDLRRDLVIELPPDQVRELCHLVRPGAGQESAWPGGVAPPGSELVGGTVLPELAMKLVPEGLLDGISLIRFRVGFRVMWGGGPIRGRHG